MKAATIRCNDNCDGTYTVDIISPNGWVMADGHFEGKSRRAKAEARAEKLSKLCKCSWETNY